MYSLRGGFLIRPLIIALALGGAGALLSWLEEMFPGTSAWVPRRSSRHMPIRRWRR